VTDEDDRAVDLVDEARDVRGVVGEAAQRVRGCEDGQVASLQLLHDGCPVRRVGEGAMDEDDGRGRCR
jgi:hypothetical protein